MTHPDPLYRRRDVLRGGLLLAVVPLAGCSGDGDGDGNPDGDGDPDGDAGDGGPGGPGSDGDGSDGTGGDGSGNVGDGSGDGGGGSGDGGGGTGGDGSDGDRSGGDGSDGDAGVAGVGQHVAGEYASLTVEYVRPVDEVMDYGNFDDVDADEPYGVPRDVEYFQSQGFVQPGASLYGVGVAVQNTGDRIVDASTIMLQSENQADFGVFHGRSQRLTFGRDALLPGEVVRAELVFALRADVSEYTLTFRPSENGLGSSDVLTVDLGRGAEGTADYAHSFATTAFDDPVLLGDYEITVHDTEFVDSVEDTFRPERFGPRPGYRYLLVDLSATRKTDEVVPGYAWRVGARAEDGYGFTWGAGTVSMYHDVTVPNRTRVDQLNAGESLEHDLLAFAVEDGFEPQYLAMNAPGPFADPPEMGSDVGIHRAIWRIE